MNNLLHGFADSVHYAMKNPFGLDFVAYDKKIYVTLGSVINCLGYNDALERIIGVSRTALGLFAFALSENKKQKIIAAGQVFRGILEMMGNFENYLLAIDIVFTVYNIGHRVFFHKEPEPEMG